MRAVYKINLKTFMKKPNSPILMKFPYSNVVVMLGATQGCVSPSGEESTSPPGTCIAPWECACASSHMRSSKILLQMGIVRPCTVAECSKLNHVSRSIKGDRTHHTLVMLILSSPRLYPSTLYPHHCLPSTQLEKWYPG